MLLLAHGGNAELYAKRKMHTVDTYIFHLFMSKENTFLGTESGELTSKGEQVKTKHPSKEAFFKLGQALILINKE